MIYFFSSMNPNWMGWIIVIQYYHFPAQSKLLWKQTKLNTERVECTLDHCTSELNVNPQQLAQTREIRINFNFLGCCKISSYLSLIEPLLAFPEFPTFHSRNKCFGHPSHSPCDCAHVAGHSPLFVIVMLSTTVWQVTWWGDSDLSYMGE